MAIYLNVLKKYRFKHQPLDLGFGIKFSLAFWPPLAINPQPIATPAIHTIVPSLTKLAMVKKLNLASLFDARIIEQDC